MCAECLVIVPVGTFFSYFIIFCCGDIHNMHNIFNILRLKVDGISFFNPHSLIVKSPITFFVLLNTFQPVFTVTNLFKEVL